MRDINGTVRLTAQIIAEIIRRQMCLPKQNIWLRDQNKVIPNDNGIYVVVGLVNVPSVISAQTYLRDARANDWDQAGGKWDIFGQTFDMGQRETNYDVSGQTFDRAGQTFDQQPPAVVEVNRVYQREDIQIDFLSRSNAGITRNWEIIAALNSILAQQMQAYYSFKIFRLPRSFVNTSSAEGGSQLNRYSITFPTFVWYEKCAVLDPTGEFYYDSFPTKAETDLPLQPIFYDQPGTQYDAGEVYDQANPPSVATIADFVINQEGIEP